MNIKLVDLIFRKELLEAFRDKKTIIFMVVLPILLYPVLGIGFFQIALIQAGKVKEQRARVAFLGAKPARFIEILQEEGDFEIVDVESPEEALLRGEIQAIIEFDEDTGEILRNGGQIHPAIRYDDADDHSVAAFSAIRVAFARFREELILERLKAKGLTEEFLNPIAEAPHSAASPEKRAGYHLGRFLPYLILMMIVNGTMYPAIDITAGEKERGTLECLLASPPTPMEIVLAKFSVVFFFGFLSAVLNLASLGLTAMSIFHSIESMGTLQMFSLSIPWEAMFITGALLIPFTILFAALLVAIASFADSFKEAQIYIMPLFIIVVLPAIVSALPGTRLEGFWLVVPVTNLCLLMKALFIQQATMEQIVLVFLCSCVYAGAALSIAVRLFSNEEVLFHGEGAFPLFYGFRLLRKWRAPWQPVPEVGISDALLVYALVFPLAYYAGSLLTLTSPLAGIIGMQWCVIFGVPLAFAILCRADLRETFFLRMPRPMAFLGLLLAFGGAAIIIRAYGNIQEKWLPVPKDLDEKFILPLKTIAGGNIFALLYLGAFTPAICEEFLCRGFLLRGLRSRLSKWQSIFIAALLFGALHMNVYQFISASLLGILLAWIALESGSILLCVLFHFINNGLAFSILYLSGGLEKVPPAGEGPDTALNWLSRFQNGVFPWWLVLIAAAILVLGCWIMKRAGAPEEEQDVAARPAGT